MPHLRRGRYRRGWVRVALPVAFRDDWDQLFTHCRGAGVGKTAITAALIATPNMVGELAERHDTLTAHSPELQRVLLERMQPLNI